MSILLIENNVNDEKLALMAFKQVHPQTKILALRTGLEAIEYLHGEKMLFHPRVILLDLKMPRISGLEVLRRLRLDSRTESIPIVIFSSSAEPEDMAQAYALGANSYISKPMDFDEFLHMVDYLKVYWLDINQLPKFSISRR